MLLSYYMSLYNMIIINYHYQYYILIIILYYIDLHCCFEHNVLNPKSFSLDMACAPGELRWFSPEKDDAHGVSMKDGPVPDRKKWLEKHGRKTISIGKNCN